MSFSSPAFALSIIPLFIFWSMNFFKILKKPELYISKKLWRSRGYLFSGLLYILGLLSFGFLAFSLAGPQVPVGSAKQNIQVNDIFFVVDVSKSMHANDFKPNRLEVAKDKIREFVALRPTDRIGIIMFSEKAFTLLPLSTDLDLIKQVIDDIKVGFLGSGTNIGDALALAVGRGTQSLAKNKVIILLTDGVSNVGTMTPLQAADEAKDQKMKVYTIGIGQRTDAAILKFGNAGYHSIPGGSIDTDTLKKVSEITGGKSFHADNEEALADVLSEIQNLEKTDIDATSRIIYKELYWEYLIWGICLFITVEFMRRYLLKEAF